MKKFCTSIIIAFTIISTITATPLMKASAAFEYSYDTNIFSNPLPVYEKPDSNGNFPWLEWRQQNPFISKHSLGGNITFDIFPSKESRVGISTTLDFKIPIYFQEIKPVPDDTNIGFAGEWNYLSSETLEKQKTAIFFGIGPIFNIHLHPTDIGCAIRLSLGAYDYIDKELILGIQVSPYLHWFITPNIFLNINFTYDAHLMRFINNETSEIYTPYYQMISAIPGIGIGMLF